MKEVIKELKTKYDNDEFGGYSENDTKQYIIERIIYECKWNIFDKNQIEKEFNTSNGRIDYLLKYEQTNCIYIEAKPIDTSLESYEYQLSTYNTLDSDKLIGILTNGIEWIFYLLPMNDTNFEIRKFASLNIYEDDIKDLTLLFQKYFFREQYSNNEVFNTVEEIVNDNLAYQKSKKEIINTFNSLIKNPTDEFIDIIKKEANIDVDNKHIKKFINNNKERLIFENFKKHKPVPPTTGNTLQIIKSNKGLDAKAIEIRTDYLKVLKGSNIRYNPTPSFSDSSRNLRNELLNSGILVDDGERIYFTRDYENTQSSLANLIMGSSVNGHLIWKTSDNSTYKEFKENN